MYFGLGEEVGQEGRWDWQSPAPLDPILSGHYRLIWHLSPGQIAGEDLRSPIRRTVKPTLTCSKGTT